MNRNKRNNGSDKLRFSTSTVRVLSKRELRTAVGGLRAGGGGGGCCGGGSELKDPYTGLGSCCDLNSQLMQPGSCGG